MIIDISNIKLNIGDVLIVALKDGKKMNIKSIGNDQYQVTGDVEKMIPSTKTLKYTLSTIKNFIKSTTIRRHTTKSEYKSIIETLI